MALVDQQEQQDSRKGQQYRIVIKDPGIILIASSLAAKYGATTAANIKTGSMNSLTLSRDIRASPSSRVFLHRLIKELDAETQDNYEHWQDHRVQKAIDQDHYYKAQGKAQ